MKTSLNPFKRGFPWLLLLSLAMTLAAGAEEKNDVRRDDFVESEGDQPVVYVLPLDGQIDQGLMILFRRAFREIEEVRPDLLIIEIDTPGGRLLETEEIIAWMRAAEVPIAAFVNTHAQSAGAIVSFGSDRIFMAPGSRIGSALPVIMGPGGATGMPDNVYEKIISDTRAMVRGIAREKGHWEDIAVAMVDPDYEVKVNDHVISEAGKLLNLTAEEAVEIIPPRDKPVLAEAITDDLESLLEYLGLEDAQVVHVEPLPAESLARWIIMIGPLLFALGILGVYMEFRTPGIGIPGLAGAVCLLIYFFGHHVGGLAGIEDLALLLIGLVLIGLEIFVIPGFGVAGVLGMISVLAGLVLSLIPRIPSLPEELPDISSPSMIDYLPMISLRLLLIVAFTGLGAWLLSRLLPKTPFYNKLVLQASLESGTGEDKQAASAKHDYIGMEGVALTALRPAGTAVFGERRLDVVSSGEMIERNDPVRVIKVEGNRIVVEKSS